jgi:hypothetical protein
MQSILFNNLKLTATSFVMCSDINKSILQSLVIFRFLNCYRQNCSFRRDRNALRYGSLGNIHTVMNWILQCKVKQGRQLTYSVTLLHIGVKYVVVETQQYFPFYCCWHKYGCLLYKSIYCFHGYARMRSLCIIVKLENISYCSEQ